MINMVALMGRLTYEPELRTTQSGLSVLSFQVACDRSYQASGQERQADFIDCVAWRQTAEFISRYFHKGSMIAVEGSIQTRNYTDKNGNNRKATEIVVNQQYFAESKRSAEENQAGGFAPAQQTAQAAPVSYASADASDFTVTGDAEDDLPF